MQYFWGIGTENTDQEYLYGIRGQIRLEVKLLEMLFTVKWILSANSNSDCTYFCPEIFHEVFPGSDTSSFYVHRDIENFAQVIEIVEIEGKLPYALLIL